MANRASGLGRRRSTFIKAPSSDTDHFGKEMEQSMQSYFDELDKGNKVEVARSSPSKAPAAKRPRSKDNENIRVRSGDEFRQMYSNKRITKASKGSSQTPRARIKHGRKSPSSQQYRGRIKLSQVRGTPDHHLALSKQPRMIDLINRWHKARLGECAANAVFWRAKEKIAECEKTVSRLKRVIGCLLRTVDGKSDSSMIRTLLDCVAEAADEDGLVWEEGEDDDDEEEGEEDLEA